MGLDEADLLDDGDSGGCKPPASPVSCSICLEAVVHADDRSWAKLKCGHRFHLDCIGSAFNAKGAMQCPNCRKIEKGQWLYANGCRPVSEFNMEDWAHDDDINDLTYSEMFGLHWCPFDGLTSLSSILDEGEFSSTASHPYPYITYVGPIHPSSASSGSISDASSFNNHWSGPSIPNEPPNSYGFPTVDAHYRLWDPSSHFATNIQASGPEQASIPPVTQRIARSSSDMTRPGIHPFIMSHSSGVRGPSTVPSMVPPFPVNLGRVRDRASSLQPHFQQSNNSPAPPRRSSSHQRVLGMAHVASAVASSSGQSSGFYLFSSSSSGRGFPEVENHPQRTRFHGWQHHSLPWSLIERNSSIWAPPFQPSSAAAASNNRSWI